MSRKREIWTTVAIAAIGILVVAAIAFWSFHDAMCDSFEEERRLGVATETC